MALQKSSIIPKAVTEYDLRLLRIFRAVVESGGFSAAEPVLGITRSTISIHVSSLETRMGLKLCLRGRSGFSLTEDGQEIYHAALDLFDSINDFSAVVSNLGKELGGELSILCADQLSGQPQQKLARVIALLHQEAPNLHLVLDTDAVANIEKQLLSDKAHVGLLPAYHHIDGLDYVDLTSEPIFLCCGKQHPLFNQLDSHISAEDLKAAKAVHPGIDIDNAGREQLKRLTLAAKAYQFDTRKTLILSGSFIGYMPQSQIQLELSKGDIRLIKPDDYHYTFRLSLVTKTKPKESKKVLLIKELISEVFA